MSRKSCYSSFLAFLNSQVSVFRERQFLWGLYLLTGSRKSQGPAFEELAVQFNMMLLGELAMRLERCLFLSLLFSGLQSWLVQPCMCFRMCERYIGDCRRDKEKWFFYSPSFLLIFCSHFYFLIYFLSHGLCFFHLLVHFKKHGLFGL